MDNEVTQWVSQLLWDIGTPRAYRMICHIQRGEWVEAISLRLEHPDKYGCAYSYALDNLTATLLKKIDSVPGGPDSRDRLKEAMVDFTKSEADCLRTNARLSFYLRQHPLMGNEVDVMSFITRWRKVLADALGQCPSELTPIFSNGATLSDVGYESTIPQKLSSKLTVYSGCEALLWNCYHTTLWSQTAETQPVSVRANRFFTVPKQWNKDRGCAVEASVSVTLQLALAQELRKALRKLGIRLDTGKETHMRLAREGSLHGHLSTIDLSRASDTLAKRLVELLFPADWFALLNLLRAKFTSFEGRVTYLEKFSSMGNGFTFELETLIFSTLAITVGGAGSFQSCFGDDIIVEARHAKAMVAALRYFGFTPNEDKTFLKGPFRESCGGDYWRGAPVRGFYLKKWPSEPQDWMKLANGLRRWALSSGDPRVVQATRAFAIAQLPKPLRRCIGPESLGDVVIHTTEYEEYARPPNRRKGFPSYRAYVPVSYKVSWRALNHRLRLPERGSLAQLAASLLGVDSQGVTPRDSVSGYRLSWVTPGSVESCDSILSRRKAALVANLISSRRGAA